MKILKGPEAFLLDVPVHRLAENRSIATEPVCTGQHKTLGLITIAAAPDNSLVVRFPKTKSGPGAVYVVPMKDLLAALITRVLDNGHAEPWEQE